MILLSRLDQRRTTDNEDIHKAVWQPACICIPLLLYIVIHGYLSGLSRPDRVVYFFRQVVGVPVVDKTILSQRTGDYQKAVEAYARNHKIPIEWAEKGVRKEDYVLPHLRRLVKKNAYRVYFIFKSMEQGSTFRCSVPKFPTARIPNHRILVLTSGVVSRTITSMSAMKSSRTDRHSRGILLSFPDHLLP